MSAQRICLVLIAVAGVGVAAPIARAAKVPDVGIVGGTAAKPGELPWQVALVDASVRDVREGQFCGGAVVAPRVVITAAHCLEGSEVPTQPEELDVVAGITRLSRAKSGQRVDVIRIVRHPTWDPGSLTGDVALLQLAEPVSVTPIGLPRIEDARLGDAGSVTTVSGWGATSEGGAGSDDLLLVDLSLRATTTCLRKYDDIDGHKQVCAGGVEGEDSCQGDSGGPLFTGRRAAARLFGIVSYGEGCARAGVPGVYTRVRGYIRFLKENIRGLNGDAPAPPPEPDAPTAQIDTLDCGPKACTVEVTVLGRPPEGGILVNVNRRRTRTTREVNRYTDAEQVAPGRWRARVRVPDGKVRIVAYPLNTDRDIVDGRAGLRELRRG